MKTVKILAAVVLLLATNTVSYYIGKGEADKAYKAAALFSDAIRIEYDNLKEDEKNCTFTAYSSLEEACCEEGLDTDSLLKEYYWCY